MTGPRQFDPDVHAVLSTIARQAEPTPEFMGRLLALADPSTRRPRHRWVAPLLAAAVVIVLAAASIAIATSHHSHPPTTTATPAPAPTPTPTAGPDTTTTFDGMHLTHPADWRYVPDVTDYGGVDVLGYLSSQPTGGQCPPTTGGCDDPIAGLETGGVLLTVTAAPSAELTGPTNTTTGGLGSQTSSTFEAADCPPGATYESSRRVELPRDIGIVEFLLCAAAPSQPILDAIAAMWATATYTPPPVHPTSTPTAKPLPRCPAAAIRVTVPADRAFETMPGEDSVILFSNVSSTPCTLRGYPKLSAYATDGTTMHDTIYLTPATGAWGTYLSSTTVRINPGAQAAASLLSGGSVNDSCQQPFIWKISIPGSTHIWTVPEPVNVFNLCAGSEVALSPVHALP